ncbi:MAG: CAP domain-containing protein [Pseudoclavibacter sp.]|nr:CAP domain-containing protein [Pseudoclavibacter sp.]
MIPTPRRMLRRTAASLLAAGLALGALFTAAAPAQADPAELGNVRAALLAEHNAIRASSGLAPLAQDSTLDSYAQSWSTSMATSGSFEHSDLSNVRALDPVRFSGAIAENIASGQQPAEVTEAWRKSPGHYANITSSQVDAVGFGYALTPDGTPYYTAVFAFTGSTASNQAPPPQGAAPAQPPAQEQPADDALPVPEGQPAQERPADDAAQAPGEPEASSAPQGEAPQPAPAAEPGQDAVPEGDRAPAPQGEGSARGQPPQRPNNPINDPLATTGAGPVGIAAATVGALSLLLGATFALHRRRQHG